MARPEDPISSDAQKRFDAIARELKKKLEVIEVTSPEFRAFMDAVEAIRLSETLSFYRSYAKPEGIIFSAIPVKAASELRVAEAEHTAHTRLMYERASEDPLTYGKALRAFQQIAEELEETSFKGGKTYIISTGEILRHVRQWYLDEKPEGEYLYWERLQLGE